MSLNELIKKLELFSADERHEEVFESSFEILKSSPQDARALRLTIVSLINLDKYEKAYKVLNQYKPGEKDPLTLEKLYVLYKLGLDKQLAEECSKLTEDDLTKGLLHLKAQHLYRLGSYEEALDIYHRIIDTVEDEEELIDLSVNERAILADDEESKGVKKTPTVGDSFDLIFNESLIELGSKNYSKSLELLSLAESKVQQLENEDEKTSELLPILLQKAYIYQLLGDIDQSKEVLTGIDATELQSNELYNLIFKNNYISLFNPSPSNPQEAFLISKELLFPNSINALSSRFSKPQSLKVHKNHARLALFTGQNIHYKDLTSLSLKSLKQGRVLMDEHSAKEQAKKSLKYALQMKQVTPALVACQLNVNIGNLDGAVEILENLYDMDLLIPGVSSLLLSLYEALNSEKKKINLFNKIYENFKNVHEFTLDQYEFLKIISFKFFESSNKQAKELLLKLNVFKKDDLVSIVLGEKDTDQLKPIDELTQGLELDELIQEGVDLISKQTIINSQNNKVTKKRHQIRKKLPKSYEESKQPDPERWLPMRDRSYYKPKKGKKKNVRETQGGAADNFTEEDLSSKSRQSTPVASSSSSKKNKKKGRK